MRGREKTLRNSDKSLQRGNMIVNIIINEKIKNIEFMKEHAQQIQSQDQTKQTVDLPYLICYLFITFLLIIIATYYFLTGNQHLFHPQDTDGKPCGINNQYPYLYFPSPQQDSLWRSTCVSKCPDSQKSQINCLKNSAVDSCLQKNSIQNHNAFNIYSTEVFRGVICLPIAQTVRDKVLSALKASFFSQMIDSATKDWSLYIIAVLTAIGITFVFMGILRISGGYSIVIFCAMVIISLLSLSLYLLIPMENSENSSIILKRNQIVAYVFGVLSFILILVFIVVLMISREGIARSILYLNRTNEFISQNYTIYLYPFILNLLFIVQTLVFIYFIYSFYSHSEPIVVDHQEPFKHHRITAKIVFLFVISLLYYIWSSFFFIHIGKLFISACIINWIQVKQDLLYQALLTTSLQLGSACLGSFLTVVFGIFKIQIIPSKTQQKGMISFLKQCYSCCCCLCIHVFFQLFHQASYVYMNLCSKSYCIATQGVTHLITEHKRQYEGISQIHNILDQYLPFIIAFLNVGVSNLIISHNQFYRTHTLNKIFVFLIIGIIGYVVSNFFINIYTESMLTMFVMQKYHTKSNKDQKIIARLLELFRQSISPNLERTKSVHIST